MSLSLIESIAGLRVPVDPNAPDAQTLLLNELAKPQYRSSQPTWFDQIATAFFNWLGSLSAPGGSFASGFGLPVVLTLAAVAIVVLFLVFGLPRLNRRSAITGALFGRDDARSASEMLSAARAAAASGDFSLAIEEGFRSMARGLAERELLTTTPGTTAHGFSVQAGSIFGALAPAIANAATAFDGVRYLGLLGTESQWHEVESLAADLTTAKPPLELMNA